MPNYPNYQTGQPNYMRRGDPGGGSQYGNPYADRFSELNRDGGGDKSYQPEQSYDILARTVESENDILPREIPMDGSFRLFVKRDLSKIYAKTWGGNGLPQTIEYEPVKKQEPADTQKQVQTQDSQILLAIFERLINVENQLSNIISGQAKPQNRQRNNENGGKTNNNQPQSVEKGGQPNG